MSWTVRRACSDDKESLYDLNRAAYQDVVRKQFGAWDERWQRRHFEEKWSSEEFEIVEHEGQRIGALSVSRNKREVRIIEILLLPDFQGHGIGTELLHREISFADERGLPVRLRVLRENRARSLYERLGFRVCGETDTHFLMERIGTD